MTIIKQSDDIRPSEITPYEVYIKRRQFMQRGALGLAAALVPSGLLAINKFGSLAKSAFSTEENLTSYKDITTYNNFYEFSTSKGKVAELAKDFKTDNWKIKVDGHVEKPTSFYFEDLIKPHKLEERIYRLRCVEAWSMVVPWVGVPLADVIKRLKPTSKAKYVKFETLLDPKRMPGQRGSIFGGSLPWPYVESLRLDEAMNPLTILAVGLYGKTMPNQNGAPIRLVVPWKYGFKSIKSIVRISFTDKQPETTWNLAAPSEYGFYANVNPNVDHPRWSQKRHRVIGGSFFQPKKETLMFNGYGEQVAHLYKGMDLSKYF